MGWVGGGRGGSSFSLSFSFGNARAVGWFPLGPREPYFPAYNVSSGYFGRVNTTNTVINNTVINNYYNDSRSPNNPALANIRYANQSVPNAVMAVPQDRFASGRRVAESSRSVSAAQLGSARMAAAPEIAPQRVSVLGPRAAEAPRAPRPPASVLSRPVVARTAPPPASVPFDRQQAALNQNPGRPLPAASVQQLRQNAPARSAPVRVVDMGRVRRIQPAVGAAPQPDVRQVNPARGVPSSQPQDAQQRPSVSAPPAVDTRRIESPTSPAGRQSGRWSTPVARPDAPSPNVSPRQRNAPQPAVVQQPSAPPPPAVDNRRQRNAPQPEVVQQPSAPPPPAADNRRSESPRRDRAAAPPAQPNRPQAQDPQPQPKQVKQAQDAKQQQPESREKPARDKTDRNDRKK